MAFWHYDMLSGRRELPRGVYTDDITGQPYKTFTYDMTALDWGFQDEEVSASQFFWE
jgi:hypothetical protein